MFTTLCYIEKDEKYLMLHRTKKKIDINKGKWIGVGGKLENNETPLEGMLREITEETGLIANTCDFRGVVVFNYNDNPSEFMHLFTCRDFYGEVKECDEGDLSWIDKNKLFELNLWEGDKIFLNLIKGECDFFVLTLNYNNDDLISHEIEFFDKTPSSNERFAQ